MDDLADQNDPTLGKLSSRLVGVLHSALHAVAEAELSRQPDGDIARGQGVIACLHAIYERALVRGKVLLDLGLETEAAEMTASLQFSRPTRLLAPLRP